MTRFTTVWLEAFRNGGEETTLARHFEQSALYRPFETASSMAVVAGRTIRVASRPPFTWWRDAVVEASTIFRRCLVPISVSALIYVIGFASVLLGAVVLAIGAPDRLASGVYIGLLRELVTWITMMILAGVAGSAVAGDLASRKVREELDALDVLGVDKFRTLVVPRVVAMTLCGLVLALITHIVCSFGQAWVATYTLHLSFHTQVTDMFLVMNPYDLVSSTIKHMMLGFFIGIVACQKGLTASGGAEGVGRAVNQTVGICFFGIWLLNSLFNFAYLTAVPQAVGLKG